MTPKELSPKDVNEIEIRLRSSNQITQLDANLFFTLRQLESRLAEAQRKAEALEKEAMNARLLSKLERSAGR